MTVGTVQLGAYQAGPAEFVGVEAQHPGHVGGGRVGVEQAVHNYEGINLVASFTRI